MVLTVSFDDFPDAVQRHASTKHVYLSQAGKHLLLASSDPAQNVTVTCYCDLPLEECSNRLKARGMEPHFGVWADSPTSPDAAPPASRFFVGAVAYASQQHMPGLWVDVFQSQPTAQTVLKAMYDEFCETGDVGDVSFEEFLKYAHPNVVILGPGEIDTYLAGKADC